MSAKHTAKAVTTPASLSLSAIELVDSSSHDAGRSSSADDDNNTSPTPGKPPQLRSHYAHGWHFVGLFWMFLAPFLGGAVVTVRVFQFYNNCGWFAMHSSSINTTERGIVVVSTFAHVAAMLNNAAANPGADSLCSADLSLLSEAWIWVFFGGGMLAQMTSSQLGINERYRNYCGCVCSFTFEYVPVQLANTALLFVSYGLDAADDPTVGNFLAAILVPLTLVYAVSGNGYTFEGVATARFRNMSKEAIASWYQSRLSIYVPITMSVILSVGNTIPVTLQQQQSTLFVLTQARIAGLAGNSTVPASTESIAAVLNPGDLESVLATADAFAFAPVLMHAIVMLLVWDTLPGYYPKFTWPWLDISGSKWWKETPVTLQWPAFSAMAAASLVMVVRLVAASWARTAPPGEQPWVFDDMLHATTTWCGLATRSNNLLTKLSMDVFWLAVFFLHLADMCYWRLMVSSPLHLARAERVLREARQHRPQDITCSRDFVPMSEHPLAKQISDLLRGYLSIMRLSVDWKESVDKEEQAVRATSPVPHRVRPREQCGWRTDRGYYQSKIIRAGLLAARVFFEAEIDFADRERRKPSSVHLNALSAVVRENVATHRRMYLATLAGIQELPQYAAVLSLVDRVEAATVSLGPPQQPSSDFLRVYTEGWRIHSDFSVLLNVIGEKSGAAEVSVAPLKGFFRAVEKSMLCMPPPCAGQAPARDEENHPPPAATDTRFSALRICDVVRGYIRCVHVCCAWVRVSEMSLGCGAPRFPRVVFGVRKRQCRPCHGAAGPLANCQLTVWSAP